jgi:hypothetical protein
MRKRDYHVDAKESSHRQWKAFGSDPTRRSMKGIRTVRILHARALLTCMQLEMYRGDRPAAPAASGDAAARVYASARGAGSSGLRATEQQRQ